MLSALFHKCKCVISHSKLIAWLAVKIRNQLNHVIGLHLGPTSDSRKNGEYQLFAKLSQQCKVVVDVGANVGDWTDNCLNESSAIVYAYEPSRSACEVLKQKFSANNRVIIKQCAVGDVNGEASFVEEFACSQTSHLSTVQTPTHGSITVKVVTLDDEFKDSTEPIDYLKIDVEGLDMKVLYGCRELLQNRKIKFIQFEYNTFWLRYGSSLQEAIAYLKKLDYEIRLITPSGLREFSYDFWGDFFYYSNFFACHREDIHRVPSI